MSSEKLIEIAENQRKVYDTGHKDGQTVGYSKRDEEIAPLNDELEATLNGGDTGYKSHYHEFWDAFQDYGNRVDYRNGFSGKGWTKETFKPKYDIIPNNATNATTIFRYCGNIDLAKAVTEAGIILNLDVSDTYNNMFGESDIDNIPPLDWRGKAISAAFSGARKCKTIQALNVDEYTTYTNVFIQCNLLENLIIIGVIAQNGVNLQWSTKLSRDSITSIINALSTTTSGLTVTLSKTAVNNAFTTDEWNALIDTKKNWTISLV